MQIYHFISLLNENSISMYIESEMFMLSNLTFLFSFFFFIQVWYKYFLSFLPFAILEIT